MKKILVSLAALFAAATMLSAQSMADATEIAKLANESLTAGELQTALDGFKEALKMAEACGDEGLELVATCQGIIPRIVSNIASGLLKEDKFDEAIAKYQEAIAVATEYGDDATAAKATSVIPQIYMKKGTTLLKAKDFDGAVAAFDKVLEADAANGNAAFQKGEALRSAGKNAEAVEAYKVAAANGQEKNANARIGNIYLTQAQASLNAKKYADAVAEANEAYQYGNNANALYLAGRASQSAGKNADAIKYYEQFLEAAPDNKNAGAIALQVGSMYQQAKNNAKAKEYYQKAVNDPKYGEDAKKALATLK
ncbi:MAG: tetratricopeptide repeat protein [Bacteroidales bacterium]|nr:tetratricopeptide repeat protein [Bacteroidales bacterium]